MGSAKFAINSFWNYSRLAVPDPTLDDDNQSDSDEYEYEVIEEIEEVEVDSDELTHEDDEPEINTKSHSKYLTISEGKPLIAERRTTKNII